MNKPEKIIEREILIYLNKLEGAFFWKNDSVGIYDQQKKAYRYSSNPYSIRGVADIIGIYNGKVYFIEVKSENGILSKFQEHFINKINSLGGNAFVAKGVDDIINYFAKG